MIFLIPFAVWLAISISLSKVESSELFCFLKENLKGYYKGQDHLKKSSCSLRRLLEEKLCEEKPVKCKFQPGKDYQKYQRCSRNVDVDVELPIVMKKYVSTGLSSYRLSVENI